MPIFIFLSLGRTAVRVRDCTPTRPALCRPLYFRRHLLYRELTEGWSRSGPKRKRPGVSRRSHPSLTPQRRIIPMRGFDDSTVSSHNAFSSSFLHRFNQQDEPPTGGEADVAGPWHVEEIP